MNYALYCELSGLRKKIKFSWKNQFLAKKIKFLKKFGNFLCTFKKIAVLIYGKHNWTFPIFENIRYYFLKNETLFYKLCNCPNSKSGLHGPKNLLVPIKSEYSPARWLFLYCSLWSLNSGVKTMLIYDPWPNLTIIWL